MAPRHLSAQPSQRLLADAALWKPPQLHCPAWCFSCCPPGAFRGSGAGAGLAPNRAWSRQAAAAAAILPRRQLCLLAFWRGRLHHCLVGCGARFILPRFWVGRPACVRGSSHQSCGWTLERSDQCKRLLELHSVDRPKACRRQGSLVWPRRCCSTPSGIGGSANRAPLCATPLLGPCIGRRHKHAAWQEHGYPLKDTDTYTHMRVAFPAALGLATAARRWLWRCRRC